MSKNRDMNKLNTEDLESINGGLIIKYGGRYYVMEHQNDMPHKDDWYVIGQRSAIPREDRIVDFGTFEEAKKYAIDKGIDPYFIDRDR